MDQSKHHALALPKVALSCTFNSQMLIMLMAMHETEMIEDGRYLETFHIPGHTITIQKWLGKLDSTNSSVLRATIISEVRRTKGRM